MKSSQALLEELATLEHRLRRARDEQTMRRIHVQLNQLRDTTREASPLVRARYFFLRGALFSKAVRANQSGYIGSSHDTLQHALELFTDADAAIKQAAREHGWSHDLTALQQRCAYEAIAVVTILKVWGESPNIMPDTSSLDAGSQRKAQAALRHHNILPSRF